MNPRKQTDWLRLMRSSAVAAALGLSTIATLRPASGQANMSCVTAQLNDNERQCDSCQSYETCYNTPTDSAYILVQGQRFDCAGLDCASAQLKLLDLCCEPEPEPSSGDDGNDDGGCSLAAAGHASGGSPAPAAFALLVLLLGGRLLRGVAARKRCEHGPVAQR